MTSKMDYRKKLMEYRKSIGATTTSSIMRSAALRDSASTLNESGSQLNFTQQQNLKYRMLPSIEEDEYIGEHKRSTTREYVESIRNNNFNKPHNQKNTLQPILHRQQRQEHRISQSVEEDRRNASRDDKMSMDATIISPVIRTITFREPSSNSDKLDNQKDRSQQNVQPQQRLQHRTLLSVEKNDYINENSRTTMGNYRKSIGTAIASPTTSRFSFQDTATNLDKLDNQQNISQLHGQSQHQHRKLLNVEEDKRINEGRQSVTRESVLKVSSPSPEPHSHPSVLPSPGYLRETSFLLEPIGRYVNWNSHHAFLASQPWCCIGDLMAFCNKYEFKAISVSDVQAHANIVSEVHSLLSGKAPFDMRRRFPGSIRNTENLFVCIGRCPTVEYHLGRILTAFRRPLNKLSTEKQNVAKQNFHLAVRELHLDISARISEIKLYDRKVFEKDFHLNWQDDLK